MFSNLYYLTQLLEKSLAFSKVEKNRIFSYAENNQSKIGGLIKIFKDEIRGIDYIKTNYQKNIGNLADNLVKDLDKKMLEDKEKQKNKLRNKMKEMKVFEQKEKQEEEKDLDLLIK